MISNSPPPTPTTFPVRGGRRKKQKKVTSAFTSYPKQKKVFTQSDSWDQHRYPHLDKSEKYIRDPFDQLVKRAGIRYRIKREASSGQPPMVIVDSIGGKPVAPCNECPWRNTSDRPEVLSLPMRHRVTDWLEKSVHRERMDNHLGKLPLSTLVVRWHIVRGHRNYDCETLKAVLGQFGPVASVEYIRPTSARVIFESLSDCCQAVDKFTMGFPDNPLHCYWYHKTMTNRQFYKRGSGLWVATNDLV